AVARQHELALTPVPQGHSPLAVEAVEGGLAPLLVGVHDDLGVALGAKAMSLREQLLAQLYVVEDLSVEHEPQRLVLIGQRLLPALQIDDGQARMGEARTVISVDAEFIGPSVVHGTTHARKQRAV